MLKERAIEVWSLDRLIPYEKNAKKHSPQQVSKIARSIRAHGLANLPNVEPDGTIITGHGRSLAMKELGWSETRVVVRYDLTKAQAAALRLADNKVSESDYDTNLVQEELRWLEKEGDLDLGDIGFDDRELAFLTEDIGALDLELLDAEETLASHKPSDDATDLAIDRADSGRTPLNKLLGFKDVPTNSAKVISRFMAVISDGSESAEQAFVRHCEDFLNA